MTNSAQHRGWISEGRLRAASIALALRIVLMAAVFATQPAQAQNYTVLYSFTGGADGRNPEAGLVMDTKGNLYGTTSGGGDQTYGTVFKLHTNGKETVLHSFNGYPTDGAIPAAGLLRDANGNFFGTTVGGGVIHWGTLFKVSGTGKEAVLYSFDDGPDGGAPIASLVMDAKNNLYGTTSAGGDLSCQPTIGCGLVFKLTKRGHLTVLHTFTGPPDGQQPTGSLVRDVKGNFYGTTYNGGTNNYGAVFKISKTGKETVLYSFAGGTDGVNPYAALIRDKAGNLFGTTQFGGGACSQGCGTVFKLDKTGKETVLHRFAAQPDDGATPYASLVMDAKGKLYGTTAYGGASNAGTVFRLDKTGKETVLYSFTGGTDGANPYANLIRDGEGNFYGTTYGGGNGGYGVVFKLTPR